MSNTLTLPELEATRDRYADLLLQEDALVQEYKTEFASFQEKFADLIERKKRAQEAREAQEEALRASLVSYFKALPEDQRVKKVALGMEIEYRTRVDTTDPEVIFQLAQFAPMLLTVNEKAVKDLGEAGMAGKGDLLAAVRRFVPALKISSEPTAVLGGVKTMSEVVQVNAAKQVMATFETATVPTTPVKPIAKRRAPDRDDQAVEAAAAALELVGGGS